MTQKSEKHVFGNYLNQAVWLDFIPPSTNRRQRWVTQELRDFYDALGKIVKVLRMKQFPSFERVIVEFIFVWPDMRKRDPDNYLKSTLDALVRAGVLCDDSKVLPQVLGTFSRYEARFLPPRMRRGGTLIRLRKQSRGERFQAETKLREVSQ